jgi:hypothetical protein
VGDIISERWAELSRNGGRHHSGIAGGFARNRHRGNPNWKPGVSGNPKGRPRRDAKYFGYRSTAEEHGLEDPVLFQHKLMADPKVSLELRATIANNISPYYRPKLGSAPVPQYVETPVDILPPRTIEQATENIAQLALRMAQGEIDFESGNYLIAANKVIIDALQATVIEARLAALEQLRGISPPTATIGGLPPLPGTNIDMHTQTPTIIEGEANGHDRKEPIVPPDNGQGDLSADNGNPHHGPAERVYEPEHE